MLQRRKSTNAPYNLLFSKHRNMDVCCPQVTRRYEILSAMVYDCFSRKLKSLWFCDPSIKKLANNEHRFSLCIIVRASVKFIVTIVSRNGGGRASSMREQAKMAGMLPTFRSIRNKFFFSYCHAIGKTIGRTTRKNPRFFDFLIFFTKFNKSPFLSTLLIFSLSLSHSLILFLSLSIIYGIILLQ